jgi:hypothetical protein
VGTEMEELVVGVVLWCGGGDVVEVMRWMVMCVVARVVWAKVMWNGGVDGFRGCLGRFLAWGFGPGELDRARCVDTPC